MQAAAKEAIELIGAAVRNPEVRALAPALIAAIANPLRATRPALAALRDTVFVHVVDVSSLALILPVVARGMKARPCSSAAASTVWPGLPGLDVVVPWTEGDSWE